MGMFLDKTKKHLVGIRFLASSLAVLYGCAMFMLPIGSLPLTCVFAFFAGILNVPILPCAYSYATKLTGQMPPAVVNGLMMSGAQLYSFISSLLVTLLLSYD